MATYLCKACKKPVIADKKPTGKCPNGDCKKAAGWDLAKAEVVEKREISDCPEWDLAADAIVTPIVGNTTVSLAGTHGFPDANCLNAMHGCIKVPEGGNDAAAICFTAFDANYSNKGGLASSKLVSKQAFKKTGKGASLCAERWFWKEVAPKLNAKSRPYLGIGQSVRPCKLCTARFSALAASRQMTIMICFDKPYDGLPGNSWLLFSSSGAGTAYSE